MTLKLYLALLLLVALGRLLELRRARSNAAWLLARGGREYFPQHYPWMVALHSAWLASCALEALLRAVPPDHFWTRIALGLFLAGLLLRLSAIFTLGRQWTTRIFVLPGAARVQRGIYRYLHHPNYLGVILEIAALPLIYGAWVTAILFSVLNLFLLKVRIGHEEEALRLAYGKKD